MHRQLLHPRVAEPAPVRGRDVPGVSGTVGSTDRRPDPAMNIAPPQPSAWPAHPSIPRRTAPCDSRSSLRIRAATLSRLRSGADDGVQPVSSAAPGRGYAIKAHGRPQCPHSPVAPRETPSRARQRTCRLHRRRPFAEHDADGCRNHRPLLNSVRTMAIPAPSVREAPRERASAPPAESPFDGGGLSRTRSARQMRTRRPHATPES